MKTTYDVIVGNLGTIYRGNSYAAARREFTTYKNLSESGYGRVSHEPVYLMKDADILTEYIPKGEDND